MIDYPRIYAFCEVASCLSFTEAANRLYTTQSSLSKNIAMLEQTLGFQLFIRNNRNVKLTQAGEYLFHFYKEHLLEMQRANNYAREMSEGKCGNLKIGILGIYGISKKISDVFLNFSKAYPLFSYEFIPMTIKESNDLLISNKVDAVITKHMGPQYECDSVVLSSSRLVAITRNGHPLFDRFDCPKLADLKDYSLSVIAPHYSLYINKLVMDTCAANGFVPKTIYSENTIYGMMMHVATSDYIGIADEDDCTISDALRQLPIDNAPVLETVLKWSCNNISDCLQKFIDFYNEQK